MSGVKIEIRQRKFIFYIDRGMQGNYLAISTDQEIRKTCCKSLTFLDFLQIFPIILEDRSEKPLKERTSSAKRRNRKFGVVHEKKVKTTGDKMLSFQEVLTVGWKMKYLVPVTRTLVASRIPSSMSASITRSITLAPRNRKTEMSIETQVLYTTSKKC